MSDFKNYKVIYNLNVYIIFGAKFYIDNKFIKSVSLCNLI